MSDGEWLAGFNLLFENRQYTAVAAQHVAESNRCKTGQGIFLLQFLDRNFRQPLGRPHHACWFHSLICADQHEPLDFCSAGCISQQICTEYVVTYGFTRIKLHHGHMLICSSVENPTRSIIVE